MVTVLLWTKQLYH